MKKLPMPAAAALLVLLTGCNGFRTQTYQDDLVMPLSQESRDSLHLTISLEYVAKAAPKVKEAVNAAIVSQAFDLEEASGTLEESAIRYRENLIDLYLNENDGMAGEGLSTWEDQLEGYFLPDAHGMRAYALSYYSFHGGAHGITTVSYLVFNPRTGALLEERDLFQENFQTPVAALMRESVDLSFADDPELRGLLDESLVAPNGNFFPDDNGITWAFQPYELGPYALGVVTVDVSWAQLKPYLK